MNERDIQIINTLLDELDATVNDGFGPFLAAIYDKNYNLIAKEKNSVVIENCSINHAEINAVKKAENLLKTYNLAPMELKIYVTAEPCMMCLGAIMWAGIKEIYYSVPSNRVEEITGFNEGFKPNWIYEFEKIGTSVYPNILQEKGEMVLEKYIKTGGIVYKPKMS